MFDRYIERFLWSLQLTSNEEIRFKIFLFLGLKITWKLGRPVLTSCAGKLSYEAWFLRTRGRFLRGASRMNVYKSVLRCRQHESIPRENPHPVEISIADCAEYRYVLHLTRRDSSKSYGLERHFCLAVLISHTTLERFIQLLWIRTEEAMVCEKKYVGLSSHYMTIGRLCVSINFDSMEDDA